MKRIQPISLLAAAAFKSTGRALRLEVSEVIVAQPRLARAGEKLTAALFLRVDPVTRILLMLLPTAVFAAAFKSAGRVALEFSDAQPYLAHAASNRTTALFLHNLPQIELASAMGVIHKVIQ